MKNKSFTAKVTLTTTARGPSALPKGNVRGYYTATKCVTVKFRATSGTKKSVTIPGLAASTYDFTAHYLGNTKYLPGMSDPVQRAIV